MYNGYKEDKEKYPDLATYFQLGMIPNKKSGKQILCTCPFCDAEDRFYVNPKSKKWDCKKCDLSGGFKSFIDEMYKVQKSRMNRKKYHALAKLKSLSVDTLKNHSFGYDDVNEHYTLYIHGETKKEIINVRIIDRRGKFLNVSGFTVVPFGLRKLKTQSTVWLTEGEWDKFALEEMLESKDIDDSVICIPGAKVFKPEWIPYFTNKNINVCYDHDEAGFKGSIKVHNTMVAKAKSMQFIHWPEDSKDKYDLRDFYKENVEKPKTRIKKLKKLLKDKPREVEGLATDGTELELDAYDGEFIAPKEIEAEYKKWMHMPSTDVLDVLFGTIIANRLPGQPLWLFLVGPSGVGKTEYVESLAKGANITSESHVTAKSLISGAHGPGGSDPSLIPKLNRQMLLIKDFTVTINSNPFEVEETFGILRDIYDGHIDRSYGNGTERKYSDINFGIIAAVTPIIDSFTKENTALGERFLKYRLPTPENARERMEYIKRALHNSADQIQMRKELSDIGTRVISYDYPHIEKVSMAISTKIMALSQFVSMARAAVMRDKYHRDRITTKPFQELGTRLAQQFSKLIRGISMYRGKDTPSDKEYEIVKQIGLSSIPEQIETVINFMDEEDPQDMYDLSTIQKILRIDITECEYVLEDMVAIGILSFEHTENKGSKLRSNKKSWYLSNDALFLIKEGELYK